MPDGGERSGPREAAAGAPAARGLVESVPNFSEGRRGEVVEEIVAAFTSAHPDVLLPGTSFLLRTGDVAPVRVLREARVTLALGTDCNPGTCYCESMQLMVALACVHGGLSPEEALLAATDGAARAVGRGGRAGRLGPGSACDLVVLEGHSYLDLAYHLGVNLARVVVKAGTVIARSGVDEGVLAPDVEGGPPHGD